MNLWLVTMDIGRPHGTGGGGGGGAGGQLPPPPMIFFFFFFCLSAQRAIMSMMIIPLHHYANFGEMFWSRGKKCVEIPPPQLISFFMQDLRDFRGWQLQLRGILPPPPPPQANTLAPPLLVCAVYDVSHLLPQPHPTTFIPTLSHNMYCHVTMNIHLHHYHYHTRPHQVMYCWQTLPQSWKNVSGKIPALTTALNRVVGGDSDRFFRPIFDR